MSSFFSERTAEYALVPALQRLLTPHFGVAAPFFFWKTREGNSTAAAQHGQGTYRVIAMFARRPKVFGKHQVRGKINYELFEFAKDALGAGIYTFAGFPAVNSLPALHSDPRILWLSLEDFLPADYEFTVDLRDDSITSLDEEQLVPGLLSGDDIAARSLSMCSPLCVFQRILPRIPDQ